MRFDAVVQTEDQGVFVEVPPDNELARARAPVTVTINGQRWESSVAAYGNAEAASTCRCAAASGSSRGSSPATPSPSSSSPDRPQVRLQAVELERSEGVEALVLGAVEVGRTRGEQSALGRRLVQHARLLLAVGGV